MRLTSLFATSSWNRSAGEEGLKNILKEINAILEWPSSRRKSPQLREEMIKPSTIHKTGGKNGHSADKISLLNSTRTLQQSVSLFARNAALS
mmetsp:Transcript_415/g.1158  ORF Transcript_415/g.1158 Transcript_415/m.1158 type:complete len:92 (-) Transcript_415:889-1164(-)